MAFKINTTGFTLTTETKEEAIQLLLKLLGQDIASFSLYMEVSVEEVEQAPQWAINYLKDLLDVELVHLGYVTKDLKALGLFVEYDDVELDIQEALTGGTLTGSKPITINKDAIVTEAGAIKAKYLVNAQNILEDFLQS